MTALGFFDMNTSHLPGVFAQHVSGAINLSSLLKSRKARNANYGFEDLTHFLYPVTVIHNRKPLAPLTVTTQHIGRQHIYVYVTAHGNI